MRLNDRNEKPLSYDDICLVPDNYSELSSRDLADTSIHFLGKKFALPVIPANMASVLDIDICRQLSENNYFYAMHRFGYEFDHLMFGQKGLSVTQKLVELSNLENWKLISISTGVNEDSERDIKWIANRKFRVDVITVDVALGYHEKVRQRINFIKKELPDTKIIAGNVSGRHGTNFLIDLGVDAIKVGIGQGSVCSTKLQTGFTAPMLWAIADSKRANDKRGKYPEIPIIADGGIKNVGDISKAFVFGATMVMSGKLFASCIDSAAKINDDGKKEYFGSASLQCKKHSKNVEGFQTTLESTCTILQRLEEIKQALQSAISYAGGKDLTAFRNVNYLVL